ncbi:glycoside hydrolase family 92 protein [Xylariaceae sp. FL0804]|nr:glycoside hydrolase family 92 protein [Xylariaceae sp. FL0804]
MSYRLVVLYASVAVFFWASHATSARRLRDSSANGYDYVDPLIGTANGGHVFAGATLPYGMAKAVADVAKDNHGGYAADGGPVTGFSHMHDSGTGGAASLGNFPLFTHPGCANDTLDGCVFPKAARGAGVVAGSVEARPGYFAVGLETGVRAEMTVSNHTALYRFTYHRYFGGNDDNNNNNTTTTTGNNAMTTTPPPPLRPLFILDLTDLPDTRSRGSAAVDPRTARMTGSGTFAPSFGAGAYTLHYCADFAGVGVGSVGGAQVPVAVRDVGVFVNNRAGNATHNITVLPSGNTDPPLPAGTYAWFDFDLGSEIAAAPGGGAQQMAQMAARVGVSFVSAARACRSAEAEVPDLADFDGTLAAAERAWRAKLAPIVIDTTGMEEAEAEELQTIFWSGVYRAMISPQDYTGENPLWRPTGTGTGRSEEEAAREGEGEGEEKEEEEPYYDSYYCLWDTFRTVHPLLTLVDPRAQGRMVRALIDVYRHEGWLPDCRMALCKGWTQGGSNADVVLVDAYLKRLDLTGEDIDWETGYEAIVNDAENEPPVFDLEGRGGLTSWKNLGYIPVDDFDPYSNGLFTRSISRTVEYAYNDFCISEMAEAMGKRADHEKYLERSGNWANLYKADQTSYINGTDTGFAGFLQPRFSNGSFDFQDPVLCSPLLNFTSCYLNPGGHETYEGSAWLYTFLAPHDTARLIVLVGGRDAFVARLDRLHSGSDSDSDSGSGSGQGLLYAGDEQAFLPIFQYHYAGRPGLSAARARAYIGPSRLFNAASPGGLPGNDDSGALGAFAALAMLGLFPSPGQDVYLVTPPFFPAVSVTSPATGRTATVRCLNFSSSSSPSSFSDREDGDEEEENAKNVYIQSATLDGAPYTKSYVTHAFFLDGGTLELTLGPRESTSWGTADEDLPPSVSTRRRSRGPVV